MSRILKYKSDVRSVGMVFLTLISLWIPFRFDVHWTWIFFQAYLSFTCNVINHNHTHFTIFRSHKLNSIFGVLLTLARGHTSQGVVIPHNLNHHVHAGTKQDWSHFHHAGSGWGVSRIFRYLLKSSIIMAKERMKSDSPKLSQAMQKQLKLEKSILYGLIIAGLTIRPSVTFIYWLVPWFLAMEFMLTINLIQHDEIKCRDFTGKILNTLFFNNGYHSVHHEKPALHWSELPQSHKNLNFTGTEEQNNFLTFFFRKYIL